MTTLIDDRRVRARERRLHDIFISTWRWPARPSLFSVSRRPIGFRWPTGRCPQAPWFTFTASCSSPGRLFRVSDLARGLGPPRQASLARIVGVSLATAMTIFGFLVSVHVMQHSAALGQPEAGVGFSIVPMSGIAFFAVVFVIAIMNTRRGRCTSA